MTFQPTYTYRAVSALTGLRVAEYPLVAGHFTRQRSGAGPWDAVLPLTPAILAADPINQTVPYSTELVVERTGSDGKARVVYTGLVTDREYDSVSQQLHLSGRESWCYFDKRLIEKDASYNPTDQGLIVQDILTKAAASPGGDLRVDLPSTAALTTGTTRQVQYLLNDCVPISSAIETLASALGGFEFSLDGYWLGNQLRHMFQFGFPKLGVRGGGLPTWDIPGAVNTYRWREQGGGMANEVFGIGDDAAGHVLVQRVKQYQSAQPLLQMMASFRATTFQGTLLSWTQQVAARSVAPVVQAFVRVPGAETPEFGTYGLGDDVALQFNDLRFGNVPGLYRLLGWTLNAPVPGQPELVDLIVESQ